jgi:hypothetical protein
MTVPAGRLPMSGRALPAFHVIGRDDWPHVVGGGVTMSPFGAAHPTRDYHPVTALRACAMSPDTFTLLRWRGICVDWGRIGSPHASSSPADAFAPPPSRQQNPILPCTKKRSVNY